MANSPRMQWPVPNADSDPWDASFLSMTNAMDASGNASRENANYILGKGGDVTWQASTGILSWDDTLEIYSTISGFRIDISATSVSMDNEGDILYVVVTRTPTVNVVAAPVVAGTLPNTDNAFALAIRRGDDIYWRHGQRMRDGETVDIFVGASGSGLVTDTYERDATFAAVEGSGTEEATIGRVIYPGSLVGLAAEITRPVTSGTVTVNVKVNAVTKMTVELNTTDTTSKILTVPGTTYAVVQNDEISVEVVRASYLNADTMDAGLTVDVALITGLDTPLADIPDASTSQKGITKLSVAPVLANDPIAVGDNDTRLFQSRRFVYTIGGGDGSDFTVGISPVMPNTAYVVLHTLATVATQVTVNCPTADRTTADFRVITSAALSAGETIYFAVMEI